MSRISIIVPIYNPGAYLNACIDSLVKQSLADIEILLIDDGSTDGSSELCRDWAQRDPRIRLIEKENGGVSSARNVGIEAAESEYLSFVDADDFVDEAYCEELLKHMSDTVDMVVTGHYKYDGEGNTRLVRHRLRGGEYTADAVKSTVIDDGTLSGFTLHSPCGVLYRREVILDRALRFNEKVKFNEDGLFNAEYALHCGGSFYIDYGTARYYYRKNNTSATKTADLFGDIYESSMSEIRRVLSGYAGDFPECGIERQLKRREATLGLKKLIFLSKTSNDIHLAHKVLRSQTFRDGLREIDPSALPKRKKPIYPLLRSGSAGMILSGLRLYNRLILIFHKTI